MSLIFGGGVTAGGVLPEWHEKRGTVAFGRPFDPARQPLNDSGSATMHRCPKLLPPLNAIHPGLGLKDKSNLDACCCAAPTKKDWGI